METPPEEKTQPTQEATTSVPEQPQPPEEPIILSQIFPKADQDLDALFPEPQMKKLLKDVVRNRQKNERFLKRLNLETVIPEEDGEGSQDP